MTPHFFVLFDYGHAWEIEPDYTYTYHLFMGRFGGGMLFGRGGARPGFSAAFHLGKRVHNNADENPWDEDYSSDGLTFSGALRFMLAF